MRTTTQAETYQEMDNGSQHFHCWVISPYDLSEEICTAQVRTEKGNKPCYRVRISKREHDLRREEWDNYYALKESTPTHQIFLKMADAFKAGQMARVKELHLELRAIGHKVEDDVKSDTDPIGTHWEPNELLPTPSRRDPINYPYIYVIED